MFERADSRPRNDLGLLEVSFYFEVYCIFFFFFLMNIAQVISPLRGRSFERRWVIHEARPYIAQSSQQNCNRYT